MKPDNPFNSNANFSPSNSRAWNSGGATVEDTPVVLATRYYKNSKFKLDPMQSREIWYFFIEGNLLL